MKQTDQRSGDNVVQADEMSGHRVTSDQLRVSVTALDKLPRVALATPTEAGEAMQAAPNWPVISSSFNRDYL